MPTCITSLHIDEQRGWRGGEQQAAYLVQGLVGRGHTVIAAGRRGGRFVERIGAMPHLETVALPLRGEWDLSSVWQLARLVRRRNVDIIHAHTGHAHSIACLTRLFAGRAKVVVSRRVDFAPNDGWLTRRKYAAPDRIVAISNRIAEVLRAWGVPEERLATIHSCIDPRRLEAPPLPRSELGVPEDAPLIGNVAALVGHKDHETLLRAVPLVLKEVPGARVLIVGDGKLRERLANLVKELDIDSAVTFLGYRDDVPRLLHTFDAFVMSSKEEGLGTSVLDAMACGLPVVATAGGGLPEIVRHEQTGLLVPVGDNVALAGELTRVIRDAVLARRLGAAGRTMVEAEFTVDRMVASYELLYRKLLEKPALPTL